ncbi:Uncharacterized protein family UPF0363 [Carpediemonas membranifera]|uniref:Uncharacterized protein family UPF0363 n=1 Tax=Carpediemonas membranifera TaxID=201153 RepID=A0A8J6E5J6_9EUKA|nr:Uncharacterized protein family UPF0363 [Carpediemonas membranifera]|eukprot:KAG9395842.1 Uncharacterized protein family UPF0363 [Carpediemonas membranifera]
MEQLAKLVDDGAFYEAHQHLNTLIFRHMRGKRYTKAFDLMKSTIEKFVEVKQIRSAGDISRDLIENYDRANIPPEEWLETLSELTKLFDKSTVQFGEDLHKEALKQLVEIMQHAMFKASHGDAPVPAALHTLVAQAYHAQGSLPLALEHYLLGDPALESIVRLTVDWAKRCPAEADLVLTRTVLRMLADERRRITGASSVYRKFCQTFPGDTESGSPPGLLPPRATVAATPLTNFTAMLLKLVRMANKGDVESATPLFQHLLETYGPELGRDESFADEIQRISKIYFKIMPAPAGGLQGMLSSLFGM